MAEPTVPIDHMGKQREEVGSIAVVCHNGLLSIAPTGDMVDGTGKLKAQRTGHGAGGYASECIIARPDPIFCPYSDRLVLKEPPNECATV